NYSKYALPLTGGVVNGDVYSKNYRTDGVAYIQRLRIENLNEINGYSDYNGGSATGNAHINYASSGIVTLCNGGGNCAIGGATALDKLHVYGRGRFVMQGKSDQSSIVTEATALTISTNSAGHTSYNTGISFNALGDYSNLAYKNHIHAWIGLGGATTTLTSECYPLVFATNPNTSIAGTPVERMRITPDGNVAIGGETASEKLHVYGNILATGAITMYYTSDKRLKQNIRKVNASKMIMSLGGVYQYEYIDSEVAKNSTYGGSHYGLIYQNVKGTALSSMCHEREDGYGSLNYLDTNFLSLIAGATMENISEVEKLKKENKALKKRVEQLEKRVA
ncbi:MAG: tail fiber domain-containing protein, partial [Alistipes sp.]|nr:tail fiber domain-containing protein [Alistipes sp.]